MKRSLVSVLVVVVSGCAVVKSSMVRPDWATDDAGKVKRLALVVQPLPAGQQKAGEVFARIARRYVNMKRDFLVKQEVVSAEPVKLEALCGGDDAIEGVLVLHVDAKKVGEGYESELTAGLLRCTDLREAWSAKAGGSFPSKDEKLIEVTAVYTREFGAEAEPFVTVGMNLLRPVLDTLPNPSLTDADKEEKLSLD